jgi:hypothetical protein
VDKDESLRHFDNTESTWRAQVRKKNKDRISIDQPLSQTTDISVKFNSIQSGKFFGLYNNLYL